MILFARLFLFALSFLGISLASNQRSNNTPNHAAALAEAGLLDESNTTSIEGSARCSLFCI